MIQKFLTQDTLKRTWISSGESPTTIYHAVFNDQETLVHSASMTSSGNGHYYDLFNVTSAGFYVSEVKATIGGNPYRRRIKLEARNEEVD